MPEAPPSCGRIPVMIWDRLSTPELAMEPAAVKVTNLSISLRSAFSGRPCAVQGQHSSE